MPAFVWNVVQEKADRRVFPSIRCLETGLSQWRPELDPIQIELQFAANTEALRQILLPMLQSSLLRTVSPTLHVRLARTLYNLPINWERNSLTHIQTMSRQLNDEKRHYSYLSLKRKNGMDEMRDTCSTRGITRNTYKILTGNL